MPVNRNSRLKCFPRTNGALVKVQGRRASAPPIRYHDGIVAFVGSFQRQSLTLKFDLSEVSLVFVNFSKKSISMGHPSFAAIPTGCLGKAAFMDAPCN